MQGFFKTFLRLLWMKFKTCITKENRTFYTAVLRVFAQNVHIITVHGDIMYKWASGEDKRPANWKITNDWRKKLPS